MSKNETLLLIAATVGVTVVLLRRFLVRRRQAERRTADQENQREAERLAAAEAARREAQRREAEEEAQREAERLAAAESARREAERREAEEEARREAERLAAAEAARREAERREAEEEARREAERLVAAEMARREAERLAAEEEARQEAERLAAAETARREAAQIAADEEARRQEAEVAQRRVREAVEPAAGVTAKPPEQTVVMVADDSKVVRVKTSRLLTAHKYQVLTAEDGLDAARQIENSLPDVLITDVDMPGLDGFQLVRQLRGNPRTANIPIIMVTSDNDVLRSEAVASGVDVVLGKPYPEEQLIAHIQKLVIDAKGG